MCVCMHVCMYAFIYFNLGLHWINWFIFSGYALKFLRHQQREFYAAGAPRYEHVGRVLLFEVNLTTTNWTLKQEIPGNQVEQIEGGPGESSDFFKISW